MNVFDYLFNFHSYLHLINYLSIYHIELYYFNIFIIVIIFNYKKINLLNKFPIEKVNMYTFLISFCISIDLK